LTTAAATDSLSSSTVGAAATSPARYNNSEFEVSQLVVPVSGDLAAPENRSQLWVRSTGPRKKKTLIYRVEGLLNKVSKQT
jgi:hypothetical protein